MAAGKDLADEVEKLRGWFLGNEDAVRLVKELGAISQIADDLADMELKIPPQVAVVELLLKTLVNVPGNPFFQRYAEWYLPVFFTAITQWQLSNELTDSHSKNSRMFAYVLREGLDQVIYVTALLVGGAYHAQKVAREVHWYYYSEGETFEEWESENESRRQPRPANPTDSHKHH